MHHGCLPALALLCAACASSDPRLGSGERPAGPELIVRVLPAARVAVEGREMNFEGFVYEMRLRCRAASGDVARLPWLHVIAAVDGSQATADLIGRLRQAAYDAGVQYIELEQG